MGPEPLLLLLLLLEVAAEVAAEVVVDAMAVAVEHLSILGVTARRRGGADEEVR